MLHRSYWSLSGQERAHCRCGGMSYCAASSPPFLSAAVASVACPKIVLARRRQNERRVLPCKKNPVRNHALAPYFTTELGRGWLWILGLD
jgi:hypothetical protein